MQQPYLAITNRHDGTAACALRATAVRIAGLEPVALDRGSARRWLSRLWRPARRCRAGLAGPRPRPRPWPTRSPARHKRGPGHPAAAHPRGRNRQRAASGPAAEARAQIEPALPGRKALPRDCLQHLQPGVR